MEQPCKWTKKVEHEWNTRAKMWNKRSENMWEHGSRKDIIPFMGKYLHKGSTVIDVGCGAGYSTYKLQAAGYRPEGIDLSKEMVTIARRQFGKENIVFHHGNVCQLPFLDDHADGLLVINVLEWTQNPSTALRELKRVLKQDGLICVGILGPAAGPRTHGYQKVYGENVIINSMMPWDFERLVTEKGMTIIDSFGVHKREVKAAHLKGLPRQLQQALSFMWVFMVQNSNRGE